MRYGSICSGVEAASLAWQPLGWKPVFFAEVEPFPCAVLMQKFNATKPLRPLDPGGEATLNMPLSGPHDEKEKKQRENWIRQINKFPGGGTIPNLGDFTKITKEDYDGEIDLLVGGTSCQSFSVAGLRKGLDDPRGNLALEFARLAYRISARWVLFENVFGLLNQDHGRAFAALLSVFSGWEVEVPVLRRRKNGDVVRGWKNSGIITPGPGGYGVAWRVLDAQFVRVEPGFPRAVPQRRRRLFIVSYFGNWRYPAEVLFEPGCFSRNPEPCREKGQGASRGFEVGPSGGRQSDVSATLDTKCKDGAMRNQVGMAVMSFAQNTRDEVRYVNGDGQIAGALAAEAGMKQTNYLLCMAHGQGNAEVCKDKSPTLNCNHEAPIVCKSIRMREGCKGGGKGPLIGDEISHTLGTGNDQTIICRESGPGFWNKDDISGPVKVNGAEPTTVICYENHPSDCRLKELQDGVCSQINARAGTGGNNLPLIMHVAGFLPGQGKKAGDIGYEKDVAPTLRSGCDNYGVVKTYGIAENIINRDVKNGGNGIGVQEELQYTLNTAGAHGVCCFVKNDAARDSSQDVAMTLRGQAEHAVSYQSTVRRLMPIECERLMGFSDNHTQIEWNGKPKEQCPDGPRYKACGNSMPVNSMAWLGKRIQMVEDAHE